MTKRGQLGGIIHTYQKYDPVKFPSPTAPPPDLASGAMEHLLQYGSTRRLTEEELARAVRIDPRQIQGLGPSLDALMELLRERKQKILDTYETKTVQRRAFDRFHDGAQSATPTKRLRDRFERAAREEQLRDLELLWYSVGDEKSPFARQLLHLIERLGEKYLVDELASKYAFRGQQPMSVPKALEIKEELEAIDRLLAQLEEAAKTAQIGIIDMDELARFAEPGDLEQLSDLQRQIQEYVKQLAEQQGIEKGEQGYRLTPKAYRLFQSKLLETIFENIEASRTGRHQGPIVGEGAAELTRTRAYEFGDSVANMDIPSTLVNTMIRQGTERPLRLRSEDIEIHRTRNNPKCATVGLLDMSGSMRYEGQYVNVKRMGLALDGLIRSEYPGDYLRFIEIFTFAKPRHVSELAKLMPKPVTMYDPIIRLRADMSDPNVSESLIPPHFTNIQHGLQLARRQLAAQDTPNRQIILITDGLPTAHFEGKDLYLLYPPDSRTEEATMREAHACARDGVTINIFLLSSWSQSREDIQFAHRMAESTKGRVFFTAGKDLDRYVVWDYVGRKKRIVG